jgi:hypothetical protein
MSDGTQACSTNAADMVVLNQKLQYDGAAALQLQALADNQADSRAWAQLKLRQAQNAATIDQILQVAAATAAQTGQTEEQQTTSPVRTAAGDAIVGGVGVSAEQVAANVANLATTMTPIIAGAIAEAVSTAITAILPALVTAVGGASTPSQTQPKPTT